jgi:MoaA/NifB/PqqE/SkfB family radical SAM enzyme
MIVTKDYYEEFEMDLTGTCNLSCRLCTRNYSHAQHTVYENVRPLTEVIEQLDSFPNLKRAFIAGQVSEPTLYPEFLDYLRYLKSRDVVIELFSNGGVRDSDYWTEIGNILDDGDMVHFTVCGSTQELHEKYRVGSSLLKILDNAEGYRRSGKTNDYCQFIEFEYNKHDYENVRGLGFTNHYRVGSEGDRLFNDKVVPEDHDVRPVRNREKLIRWILNNRPSRDKSCIQCVSIAQKKMYISQSGVVYPCYMHCEYDLDDVFDYDYTGILNHNFDKCSICDKDVRWKVEALGLDFLC